MFVRLNGSISEFLPLPLFVDFFLRHFYPAFVHPLSFIFVSKRSNLCAIVVRK